MTTLNSILTDFRERRSRDETATWPELEAALLAREDAIADALRLAGAQLGAMPEFVAETLCQVGLGTQPDDETRALIHQQFVARMAWLQEEFRRQQGGG